MARRSAFGSIDKRGKNVYRIRWHDKATGKQRSETIHGPRAAAQKRLDEIDLGLHGGIAHITYSEYYDRYVEPTFADLAPKTASEYRRVWNVELKDRIGQMDVAGITWRDVQSVISEISAPSVQRKAYRLWRKIGNMAMRDGFTMINPCNGGAPKMKRQNKREKAMVEAADVPAFMDAIRGIKYEPVILLMLGCGVRLCEAVGMTWECCEDWNGYLVFSIVRDVVTVDGEKVIQEFTKTDGSTREVVMGEPFASRMRELRGEGFIVGGASPSAPGTMSHNWKYWCARNGLEYVRLGDVRSIYTTLMGEAGAPDSLVSLSMGHADGTTKGAHYQMATRRGLALIADIYYDYLCPSCDQSQA